MQKIYVPDFHKSLVEDNHFIREFTEEVSGHSVDVLSKKPAPGKWSVLECYAHMNILYEIYLKTINQGIVSKSGKHSYTDYYKPTLIGHYFYLSMAPNKKKKPRNFIFFVVI